MELIAGSTQLPSNLRRGILTMGNFDGVHLGHQGIIAQIIDAGIATSSPTLVYTFDPHPAKLLAPALALKMIQTTPQRLRALAATGITATVVEAFTPAFANLSPDDFFHTVLQQRLAPRAMIIGYDLTYGHHRKGRAEDLIALCQTAGIDCTIVDPLFAGDVLVSSTYVRQCVRQGHLEAAADALGRPFALEGELVRGRGVGRHIGFPTLNLVPDNELLPPEGVYISSARWDLDDTRTYPSATYLGRNPTFGGTTLAVETYLLEDTPPESLERIEVALHRHLRGDIQFRSPEELKAQIAEDVAAARHFHGFPHA